MQRGEFQLHSVFDPKVKSVPLLPLNPSQNLDAMKVRVTSTPFTCVLSGRISVGHRAASLPTPSECGVTALPRN